MRKTTHNRFGAINFASRRAFLKATGAGTVLAPFIPLLEAQAQNDITRLFIVTGHNGYGEANKFYPSGSGTNFTMASTCNSLEPYKKDIIFFREFEGRYRSDEAGVHPMASANLLTGSVATRPSGGTIFERQDATRATSISIDQFVANRIGTETPHKSLVMGVGADPFSAGDDIGGSVSYKGASDPVIAESDVFVIFDRVFGNLANQMNPGTGQVNVRDGDDRSILDAVTKNLDWLKGRVGAEDLRRLDAHLGSIRELEKRLPPLGQAPTTPDAADECVLPNVPERNNIGVFNTKQAARFLPEICKAHIDVALAAMACDLTRVGLLQVGVTTALWPPIFMGVNRQIHDISHNFVSDMTRFTQLTLQASFAYLLKRLNEVQEGGVPLMRKTAAFWTNEFGDGARHQGAPMPIIAAGQANGKWQTGRYVPFGSRKRHTDFLVSVARTFGADVNQFGTDPTGGPLPELGV